MTAIKKFFGKIADVAKSVWSKIKNACTRLATTCSKMKFKYYYLLLAFVLVLALLTGVGFIIDSNVAELYDAPDTTNDAGHSWHYNSLYSFINNYDKNYAEYQAQLELYKQGIGKAPNLTKITYNGSAAMSGRIVQAAQNRAEGVATSMDEFWLTTGIDLLDSISSFLYNERQVSAYASTKVSTPFFSLIQAIVMLGLSIAMILIITKTPGNYNLGFTPAFGNNTFWYVLSLASLILTLPCALYSLFGKSFLWPTILLLSFIFAQTTLVAFAHFTLRKQGASKTKRLLLPTAASYGFTLIYFLLGMANASYYGTFGAMSLYYSTPLVAVILFIAPLWLNAAYLMTGSFMASALPYACLGFTFSIFPAVIGTMGSKLYAIIFFALALLAFLGASIALWIMVALKAKKGLPIPADIACEMYEEGAPEITVPEDYVKAVKEKKEKKIEKKAQKNDFAFLDEPEKTETADENQNTPV